MKNIFFSLIGIGMLFSFTGKGSLPKNIEVKITNRYPNAHIPLSKDLPLAVKKGFDNSKYVSWHIDNIKEVSMKNASPVYVIHVDNGDKLDSDHYDAMKKDVYLSFDTEGVLVHLE